MDLASGSPAPSQTSALGQRIVAGVTWSAISQGGQLALRFAVGVVLTRLLSPRDFGLVTMLVVFSGFGHLISELGLGATLVQKQDAGQEQLSTAFWLNLVAGLLVMIIFMLSAPLIAGFYQERVLAALALLAATQFAIGSLSVVHKAVLTKGLSFRVLSLVEIGSVGAAGAGAIALAALGAGVWSLAGQSFLEMVVTAALIWRLNAWRPNLAFKWAVARELLGFSRSVFGSRLVNYWMLNADFLLIGHFLSAAALGVYARSYSLMLVSLTNLSLVISRVMFPSLALIQADKERVKRIYLRVTRATALLVIPLALGFIAVAEPFVLTVFGSRWLEIIPVARVLCIAGLAQSLVFSDVLYLSQGRPDLQFTIGGLTRIAMILGIIIGLRWGILGVALGYVVATLLTIYPSVYYAGKLVRLTFAEWLGNLLAILLCAAIMAAGVWGIVWAFPPAWPHWLRLAGPTLFGLATYLTLILIFERQAYLEFRLLLREQLGMARAKLQQAG